MLVLVLNLFSPNIDLIYSRYKAKNVSVNEDENDFILVQDKSRTKPDRLCKDKEKYQQNCRMGCRSRTIKRKIMFIYSIIYYAL